MTERPAAEMPPNGDSQGAPWRKRLAKNLLAAVVLGLLGWYLYDNWHRLERLSWLPWWRLTIAYATCLVGLLVRGAFFALLVHTLTGRYGYRDMLMLQSAAQLLNYLPMRGGTLLRAAYLKKHYHLSYTRFAAMLLFAMLLMGLTASILGMVSLLATYGLQDRSAVVLACTYLVCIVLTGVLIAAPIPHPKGTGRLSRWLRALLEGRRSLGAHLPTLAAGICLLLVNFLLSAHRFSMLYEGMGVHVPYGGLLILGSLNILAMFVPLTPGGLGVREAVLGAGAMVLAVSPEVGVLVAMVERGVTLSFGFVIGGPCALWLWRKSAKLDMNQSSGAVDDG